MTTLMPTTRQDHCHDDLRASSTRLQRTRDQRQSRSMSGDRLTAVMAAGDTRLGGYGRGDLAAQGSLQSVSIGTGSWASTFSSDAQYNGQWSTTLTYNTAVGPNARAWGLLNTAIGGGALAGRDGVTVVKHRQATAVGAFANAEHDRATALGATAVVEVDHGVALGAGAYLSIWDTTPLKTGNIGFVDGDTIQTRFDTRSASAGGVSVGNRYQLRQLKNLADATELTDVVTVRQLLDVVRQANEVLEGGPAPGRRSGTSLQDACAPGGGDNQAE